MADTEKLKKLLSTPEKKPDVKAPPGESKVMSASAAGALPAGEEEVDINAISKIVERMKDKYAEEGVMQSRARESEGATKLRGKLEYAPQVKIGGGSPKELVLFENPVVRFFGKFYNFLESPISSLSQFFYKGFGQKLERDLASANMVYSVEQYLTLAVSAGVLALLVSLAIVFILVAAVGFSPVLGIILAFVPSLLILIGALMLPASRANKIANAIDKELPFALRHMSIEIRAGVGIFKTMESIATSNYGALSDGFREVLFNIEKGMPTEVALEKWAEKTRSEGLRRMISHLVRALRTGGNLSDIMVTIAEDVSFERRMKIADFAEKLNLLALFLMMTAVVFPVMITILTSIGSAPSIKQYLSVFSVFNQTFLALVYFVICPAALLMFMYFIKASDPE